MSTVTDTGSTDRIERSIVVNAPRSRVWRALSDPKEFGQWFGCDLEGQSFQAGRPARGRITIKGYEHIPFDIVVDRIEPEHLFAYRWHPYAMDASVDDSKEQRTLVTFTLEESQGGKATVLKVVESGFDAVPAARRAEAFRMNSRGWEGQMNNIVRHVAAA